MKNIKLFIKNIKEYSNYAIRSAKAELKSEITDSYLNWLWWIIEPLCFMLIYVLVFGYIFKASEEHFIPFVLIGITVWEFFNRMVTGSIKLVIQNREVVSRVYLPKYVLLIAKSYTYLFKLFISFGILFVIMFLLKVPFTINILYMVPVLTIFYIFSFGVASILMHFGVYVQDLGKLTNIVLKFVFYLSGIFYNINVRLKGKAAFLLLRVNPVAFLMNEFRKVIIYGKLPSFQGLAFWLGIGLVLTYIGISLIHKNENSYAKVI
ncbi:MAG: ABC transporter permease [Bacilli bacterium]|nr:ABC transporter permease [Bacilli bacterium]